MKKLIFVLCIIPFTAPAIDITAAVKNRTNFDERIASACSGKCGNRGYSELRSVDIQPIDGNDF